MKKCDKCEIEFNEDDMDLVDGFWLCRDCEYRYFIIKEEETK